MNPELQRQHAAPVVMVSISGRRPRGAAFKARAQLRCCSPDIRAILDATAARFGIEPWQILERTRLPNVLRPRYVAFAVVRERLGTSYPLMGYAFGYGHSVVMYAMKQSHRYLDDIAAVHQALDWKGVS